MTAPDLLRQGIVAVRVKVVLNLLREIPRWPRRREAALRLPIRIGDGNLAAGA